MQVGYGGIAFEIVRTNLYHREPVLSEDRTELLFMRTTYDLTMIWNPSATAYAGTGGNFAAVTGASPGQTDAAIRYHLLKPRLPFVLATDEGFILLTVPRAGFDRDPDNGPKPVSCDVSHVCSKTWRVNWRVVVCSIECDGGGAFEDVPPILSNRYSQSQETGLDRLTRTVTRGVTTFRADALAHLGRTADFYRSQCIPGLPLGFQRQVVQVSVSPGGTILLWSVVDQELNTAIGGTEDPRRGTVERFEASFSMSSIGPDAGNVPSGYVMARFDGFAWGAKDSSRSAMLGWLARLAIERMALPIGAVDPSTQPLIMRATASEKIDSPFVELHIDVKFPPAKQVKQGLGPLRADFLGIDILNTFTNDGRNPQMPGDNNTRGTANVLAFAAAIKEACSPVPSLPYATGGSPGYHSDNHLISSVSVEITSGEALLDSVSNYSYDATTSGAYTEMSVQTKIKTTTGKLQVPSTGPVSPSSSGGSLHDGDPPAGYGGQSLGSTTDGEDDEPDCVILTLSRPMTEVTVTFEAERSSVPPIIPNAQTTSKNLVLLEEEISPMAVGLATDGVTPVFRIGGVYRFAARKARKPGAAVMFGVHPFTAFSYADTMAQLGPESYAHGIYDPLYPESSTDSSSG